MNSNDQNKYTLQDGSVEQDGAVGGEDESSTENNGDDSHLHEDQKSRPLQS